MEIPRAPIICRFRLLSRRKFKQTVVFNKHMQIPKRRSDKLRKYDESPVYLTPQGLKILEERLARLKRDMPGFIDEAQRTAAYGDRSDNAEYKEAKSILRRAQGQIFGIQEQLKRVVKIISGENATKTVQLGSTVVLESDGKNKKTFQIVGSLETNPGEGRISHKSPLGAALIGRAKGDTVAIQTANGASEYRVLEIKQ